MRKRLGFAAALVAVLMVASALPAGAGEPGDPCGCTPGYWKTHPDVWADATGTSPDKLVTQVFDLGGITDDLNGDGAPDTLLDALNYGGGPGIEGAARNLLRAAVAAGLNRRAFGAAYFGGHPTAPTNAALASGDRDAMLELAEWFDFWNNTLCELDAHGNYTG